MHWQSLSVKSVLLYQHFFEDVFQTFLGRRSFLWGGEGVGGIRFLQLAATVEVKNHKYREAKMTSQQGLFKNQSTLELLFLNGDS